MTFDQIVSIDSSTIQSLARIIYENQVTEQDTIVVDENVFDELALDYRRKYGEGIPIPFYYNGPLIEPAPRTILHSKQAGIIINDSRPSKIHLRERVQIKDMKPNVPTLPVYRCGYCGAVVGENGNSLSASDYQDAITRWKTYGDDIIKPTHGECCRNK